MTIRSLRPTLASLDGKVGTPIADVYRQTSRLRGRKLQKRNRRILADDPLCPYCRAEGRANEAQVVDHDTALADGGLDALENLVPICDRHHRVKSAREAAARRSGGTPVPLPRVRRLTGGGGPPDPILV